MASESTIFKVQWGAVCGLCGFDIEKGEYAHYVRNNVLAHEHCHDVDGPAEEDDLTRVSLMGERESGGYRVRGRRNHEKPCELCFLTHAGECP